MAENSCPKDLLERGRKIEIGDFVTTNDRIPLVVYVLADLNGSAATACGVELTETKDDVYYYKFLIHVDDLIYLGPSYANHGGVLDKLRTSIIDRGLENISFTHLGHIL